MIGTEAALPPPPARERRVLPAVAVVAAILVVVLGGYVTAGALSTPAGPPIDVAGRVRVHPLSGWELARRFGDPPTVRITRGSASLDVAAVPFGGPPVDLLGEYVEAVLEAPAEQLSVSRVEDVAIASGLVGARVAYVGTFPGVPAPIEGQVTAIVSGSGVGVVFDGWSPSGLLQFALDDIETMIDGAEVA